MLLTLQSAVEDIKESPAVEVNKIARVAAHGSLMGARGNSGVILSQIFRGFGNAVQGKAELTPADLADALAEAANAAYRAVIKPTEGTILTVAREAGRAAGAAAGEPGATGASVIKAAAAAARTAVDRTPSQLKILHEAGVVDAGGYGLQIMLDGMLRSIEETEVELLDALASRQPAAPAALELPEEGWGYCTEFLIHGEGLDLEKLREDIAAMGNSALVVGDPDLVRVHVHTDEPSRVINLASTYGRLDRLNVGDMSTQHRRIREESGAGDETVYPQRNNGIGLVAVVAGSGLANIMRGLGADAIVEGGQTMNPSTQDMLAAVDRVPYQDVILLPNNRNVVLAATQVNGLTSKGVRVLETTSVPEGVAALVSFHPDRDLEENLAAMRKAAERVQTIEVTHAVRDSRSNGVRVKKGDVIALINDKLQHAGKDYRTVVKQALDGIGADGYELVTIYRGQQATDSDAENLTESIRVSYPDLEVELQPGGQEHYPFILSVE
jgi:DAK2 domain fusion protein YloV